MRRSSILTVALTALLGGGANGSTAPPAPLNDTALQRCLVAGRLQRQCAGTGQDAAAGRDVTRPNDADGVGGFSFVKIDAQGAPLPGDAPEWPCVHDRVTGLLWEAKTDDGGPHDYRNEYTAWGDFLAGDASRLVRLANRERLCGYDDWRLPNPTELLGLAHFDRDKFGPYIDVRWFPHTMPWEYWTATINAREGELAWTVGFGQNYFGVGTANRDRDSLLSVRLVRGDAPAGDRFVVLGDEVADRHTGLVWRRCVEGRSWVDSACAGTDLPLSWPEALAHADEVARATGVAWRLPNAKELASLVDFTQYGPALDRRAFPPDSGYRLIWSSSVVAIYTSRVTILDESFGSLGSTDRKSGWSARLVRDAR